jgi:hypothetical protein
MSAASNVKYLINNTTTNIANPSNNYEWLGGIGTYTNEQYPGGFLYSPTSTPRLDNKKNKNKDSLLLSGNVLSFLGSGFSQVQSVMNYGFLGQMFDNNVRSTEVYKVKIKVTDTQGKVYYEGESNSISKETGHLTGSMNLGDLKAGIETGLSLQGIMGAVNSSPVGLIGVSISIVNIATSEDVSVEGLIGGITYNSVVGQITSLGAQAATSALGLTGITGMLAQGLFGAIFGELMEMAVGLDRAFGIGGEYQKYGVYGESKGLLGAETLGKNIREFFGASTSYDVTNRQGDVLGTYTVHTGGLAGLLGTTEHSYDLTSIYGDVYGAGFTQGEALETAQMEVEMNFMDTYSLTNEDIQDLSYNIGSGSFDGMGFTGLDADQAADIADSDFGIGAQLGYDGSGNDDGGTEGDGTSQDGVGGYGDGNGGWGGV